MSLSQAFCSHDHGTLPAVLLASVARLQVGERQGLVRRHLDVELGSVRHLAPDLNRGDKCQLVRQRRGQEPAQRLGQALDEDRGKDKDTGR